MESVIGADDAYTGGDYVGAKDAYIKAGEQVRYADNAGLMYIERKLRQIREYEQVFDSIELGIGCWSMTITSRQREVSDAKEKASSIYFNDGKQWQALDALDSFCVRRVECCQGRGREGEKEQEKQSEEQAAKLCRGTGCCGRVSQTGRGSLLTGRPLMEPTCFTLIAMEKYAALDDTAQIEF